MFNPYGHFGYDCNENLLFVYKIQEHIFNGPLPSLLFFIPDMLTPQVRLIIYFPYIVQFYFKTFFIRFLAIFDNNPNRQCLHLWAWAPDRRGTTDRYEL